MTAQQSSLRDSVKPLLHPAHGVRRRGLGRWVGRGVLVIVGLAGGYALISAFLPDPIVVDVGVAERGTMQVFVEEDGRTRVRDRYVVAAPLSGTVRRVDLEVGDRVAAGDVVATLTPPAPVLLDARSRDEQQARLAGAIAGKRAADAALSRAGAARELASVEASRARVLAPDTMSASERDRLVTQESLTREEYAAALEQRRSAVAAVAAIRATLATEHTGPSADIEVHAPAAGRVLRKYLESESPVAMGTPLLEIGDTRVLEVVVDVLSSDAVTIEPGAAAWIEEWGGRAALPARVRRVEPAATTHLSALGVEEQRANVIVDLDSAPAALGDGYRIEARLLAWEGVDVIHVPASAVFRHGDGWSLYVAQGATARLRPIEVGHRSRDAVEITSGVEAQTAVILYPGDKLHDGAAIRARR